jgi:hypothetical protein
MCLDTKPNCLVILLQNGVIHHCVFLPNKRSSVSLENMDQINVLKKLFKLKFLLLFFIILTII